MAITQRLTLDEFLALPAEEPALELEPDGTVVQKVSPQGQHSRLQLALCEQINRFAEGRRLALAFPELRVVFGGAAYEPDVSVFRWDRIPRGADGDPQRQVAHAGTPELVDRAVRILSDARKELYLLLAGD